MTAAAITGTSVVNNCNTGLTLGPGLLITLGHAARPVQPDARRQRFSLLRRRRLRGRRDRAALRHEAEDLDRIDVTGPPHLAHADNRQTLVLDEVEPRLHVALPRLEPRLIERD